MYIVSSCCHFYFENFVTSDCVGEHKGLQILLSGINSCGSRGYIPISCDEPLPLYFCLFLYELK